MTELIRTEETVHRRFLRRLLSLERSDHLEDRIDTHSGAWIREGQSWRWRWWTVPEDE